MDRRIEVEMTRQMIINTLFLGFSISMLISDCEAFSVQKLVLITQSKRASASLLHMSEFDVNTFSTPIEIQQTNLFNILIASSSEPASEILPNNEITMNANSDELNIAVFLIGIFPFIWATIEFWRRIAVGLPFGTGSDSIVIIGEDNKPSSSRGRQVLGKGALVVAYILFAIAGVSVGVSVFSVIASAPPTSL